MTEHYGSQHFGSQHFGSDHFAAGDGSGTTYADMGMVATAAASGVMALDRLLGAQDGHGAHYWRTVRKNRENRKRLKALYTEVRAADPPPAEEARIEAVAPALRGLPPASEIDWAAMAAETEQRLEAALEAAAEAIEQEDEELMLLLAA